MTRSFFRGSALEPARASIRGAIDNGLPVLGICLGMQLLLDSSAEGTGRGLGVIPGVVRRIRAARVPQIGWNTIEPADDAESDATLDVAYYANSFVCEPTDERCVVAWSSYGHDRFPAVLRAGPTANVVGVQFHPEKSSSNGVRYLRALLARMVQSAEVRR
jgi:imidazole glycerol-phosphate synthase subunit HisH